MMMPVRSASSYSSTFGFVSHRLLTVIVAFWTGNGSSSSDTGYSQSSNDYGCSERNSDSGCSKSSSDSGCSKDSKEDDPDWSGEEEEQSGHQAEDDLAMVVPVLPEDGLAMVVAPAIPQLGDMTTPIVVEDYIPQLPPPPRRSWRIRLRKEKEKNNEN